MTRASPDPQPGAGSSSATSTTEADATPRFGRPFWLAVVIGTAMMGWGVRGYLEAVDDGATRLDLARWLVGADLAHDLLVAPAVLAIAWLVHRLVPPWARPPVQAGLVVSATVLVLAWLPLHRTAEPVGNPTIQPLDYPTATLWALAIVWAIPGIVLARRGWRRLGSGPAAPVPADDRPMTIGRTERGR